MRNKQNFPKLGSTPYDRDGAIVGNAVPRKMQDLGAASNRPIKSATWVACAMTALVSLGCLNFVLVKAMYDAFGAHAYFCNQGVNLLYILYGGVPLILGDSEVTKNGDARAQSSLPHRTFFGLAFFDGKYPTASTCKVSKIY